MRTLLFVVAMLAISGSAYAERELLVTKEGVLVVTEVTRVRTLYVPGVPKGLSAEVAYKLVTGELKEAIVGERGGAKIVFVFSFPFIHTKEELPEKKITYHDSRWFAEQAPSRITEPELDGKVLASFVMLWLPVIIIVGLGLRSSSRGLEKERLAIFYGALFTGVLVGVFFNWLTGMTLTAFALGTVAGAVAGGFAGGPLVGNTPIGVYLGAVAGILVGGTSTGFALTQDHELAMQYCRFILGVEVGCLSFVCLIDVMKRLRTTAKGN